MIKIAVTGGLASGKSTVCKIIKESFCATVVDTDKIAHILLSEDSAVKEKIVELFGSAATTDGRLDREKIASIVFTNNEKLTALENLLHPLVFDKIKELYSKQKNSPEFTCFVAEVPLLFESGMEIFFDATIAVHANEAACQERFIKSDFAARIKNQMAMKEKIKRADYTIENSENEAALKENVLKIMNQISKT